ncbi:PfkB family carbohydrate kinase [Galbitalea sp. SE-J8]|uniref:PfkB family carbohydrate kinase n=1 Tax=Galbitalea sp. SE-J8 TaxID=3054952 RepID=UPI00259D2B1E|nr:PfkB family carbohydrate kinase [Galbitalea sp. SE-J8]MDM4762026.1 PfkB family carbohydrate kinase [Galbitalea sp. SE-J8]
MTESTVVVIGDALIDVVRVGEKDSSFVGGSALNVAVGLAVLGVPVTLIAMVGDDEHGATIRAFLAGYGVGLIATPAPLGTSVATSDRRHGEPRYEFNEAALGRRVEFGDAALAAIAAAALVVVSGFPFDDDEQAAGLALALAGHEHRLLVDPNPRSALLRDRARFRRNFEDLVHGALLVKVGDDDAGLLYATGLAPVRALLRERGPRAVLATAGAAGASLTLADGTLVEVGVPASDRPVVDTMGAGDACLATATAHIARNGDPTDAADARRLLERAMLIAGETCRSVGALLRLPAAGVPADGVPVDGVAAD